MIIVGNVVEMFRLVEAVELVSVPVRVAVTELRAPDWGIASISTDVPAGIFDAAIVIETGFVTVDGMVISGVA